MSDINNTNDAVRVLWQRFDVFDGARQASNDARGRQVDSIEFHRMARDHANGTIGTDDLRAVVEGDGFTQEEKEAAQYLLDHPDVLDGIDGADDGGDVDGKIGHDAVFEYIDAHRGSFSYEVVAAADARAILREGHIEGGEDDYDTRLLAFTRRMGELSPENRQLLMNEILRQDSGAQDSWLQLDRLERLRSEGGQDIAASSFDAAQDVAQSTPDGVRQMIEGDVVEHAETYSEYADELNWLVTNLSPSMTPAQLEEAIRGYIADKNEENPGWEQEYENAQNQMIEDGAALLERLGHLDPQAMSAEDKEELLNSILEDHPEAQMAILLALNDPAAVNAETLDAALGFFDGVELSGKAPELASALGQAYLARVRSSIEAVDPNDPATVERAQAAVDDLRHSNYAKLLDLPEAEFNAVVDALEATVPGGRISTTEMGQRLERLATAADNLDAAADRAGITQGLRALGLVSGAIGLYSSGSELFNDPANLEAATRTLTDLVGLGNTGAEALNAVGRGGTFAARLGSAGLGKLLGAVGIVFGAIDFGRNVRDGDYAQAGLTAAGVAGTALATFGTASWTGPVGILIGTAAVAGSIGLNQWRNVDASNEHMNDVSREFLQHAGLSEDVAGALVDQSGEGYSPVPFLFEYAASRGLDQEQTIAWLNSLDGDDLESIRDRAHEVLDSIDGDLSKLDGDSDPEVLEFLSGYSEAEDRGDVYTHDQGNGFTVDTEYRQIVAGTWEEFSAVLSAKDRPLPTA